MVAVANTKMMVRPTRRISSAISFGVFCRSAPSTSLIMRSRKVEPSAAVMRTLIQSDSTCVPPVTAERSPPDSRMTGADSPVIAASLTEALPSTSTTSPTLRLVLRTNLWLPRPSGPVSSLAWVSVRWRRNAAACALPRPSAIASAKLANSSVNHSHSTIWNSKPMFSPPLTRSRINITVVSAVTTSSTNITGFFIRLRGSSLTKADPIAGTTILGSNSAETGICLRSWEVSIDVAPRLVRREQGAGSHREMFDNGAQGERGEEGQPTDDHDHADHEADEEAAGRRERACRRRHRLLFRERARDRHGRDDHPEAADQH